MYSIQEIKKILKESKHKINIVMPEGSEEKIQQVASILVEENIAKPILLFDKAVDIPSNLNKIITTIALDKMTSVETLAQKFVDLRKGKATLEDAKKLMTQRNYVGTMLVKDEVADCMLCGLTYTTADTLRPALQIIKTKPTSSLASSIFIMNKENENLLFTDCGLNIKPTPAQLADIAKMAAEFAQDMKIDNPEVAMLSYSTDGSGIGEDVDRVKQAVQILKDENVAFSFDGEMQFDAAYVKEVRNKKFPNTKLIKDIPDIFVFPEIQSGNIGYKIAQRLGGYEALGPFILGLNKPVNDLSRGATLNDILNTALITAFQAFKDKK